VLEVAVDCSGASCPGLGTRLSSVAACSTTGALGGTYLDVLCSATVSTDRAVSTILAGAGHDSSSAASLTIAGSFTTAVGVAGPIGSALGAACSLVAIVAADDGLPLVASCSGISVDARLQFDKGTVDDAYYYLPLLLMLTEVCRYLHVRLAMCG
jgi:hypothetical protein